MFQGHIDLDTATPVEASAIPDVLFERGLYWASGRSGVVNLVAAHKWFNLAALKGRPDAISMRREVAEMMSDAEIATAQREARTWMTTHEEVCVGSANPAVRTWADGRSRAILPGRLSLLATGSLAAAVPDDF